MNFYFFFIDDYSLIKETSKVSAILLKHKIAKNWHLRNSSKFSGNQNMLALNIV